jgi:hypothetical protein
MGRYSSAHRATHVAPNFSLPNELVMSRLSFNAARPICHMRLPQEAHLQRRQPGPKDDRSADGPQPPFRRSRLAARRRTTGTVSERATPSARPASGEWEVRGDAWAETRIHFCTGITSVVPWLVVSGSNRGHQRRGRPVGGCSALTAAVSTSPGRSPLGKTHARGRCSRRTSSHSRPRLRARCFCRSGSLLPGPHDDGTRAERGGGSGRGLSVLHGGRERRGALLRRRRIHPHDLPAMAVEVEEAT